MQPLKPKSREHLSKIMTRYYEGNHALASEGKFVVWIAIIVPTELLKGFDLMDANIVYSTYATSIGRIEDRLDFYEWDGSDPLRYLGRIQNRGWCCYGMDLRYKAISEMIERFSIDGLVFASNRSCKVYSVMQMDLKRRLARDLGTASVMIDVDHADVRKYSEANAFLRLEALLEQIDDRRAS